MSFWKVASALLAFSCVALNAKAEEQIVVELDSSGVVLTTPFLLSSGATIQNDWFAFTLNITNHTYETLIIPVKNIIAEFGPEVGSCQGIDSAAVGSYTIPTGVTLKTASIFCGGLQTGQNPQRDGTLTVNGVLAGSGKFISSKIPVHTH